MEIVPYGSYGAVVVTGDDGELRIGYYDDDTWLDDSDEEEDEDEDEDREGARRAIVYYSEPPFLFDNKYHLVSPSTLHPVDTNALFRCRDSLGNELILASRQHGASTRVPEKPVDRYALLLEWSLLNSLLAERMLNARSREGDVDGRRVFISHSSTDKPLAVSIAVDIANHGHAPWLDQWEIRAGESIPVKISEGLEQCDFVVLLMSRVAVESGWVEAEWTAKYWDEVTSGRVQVIPVLLEDCKIPTLLKTKKYADFRMDYQAGLEEVITAIF